MRFLSLANRNMKEIYRDPLSIGMGLFMPIGLLLLFTAIGKRAPLDLFTVKMLLPGVIVFSFSFLIMFSAILLAKDRQSAFLTRLLATPLKPTGFITAYILPYLPIALLQSAACFMAAVLLGYQVSADSITSLLILLPMALACVGMGMTLGALLTENQIAAIGSIAITAASIFSGAWMDLKMVGGIFEKIGHALPFYHAINAARAILQGAGFSGVMPDLYWVLGYAAVFSVLGVLAFAWRTKR